MSRIERNNVTLSVPVTLWERIKHLAVQRDTSMSQLTVTALIQLVDQEDLYEAAWRGARRQFHAASDLGSKTPYAWTRTDSHERRL
ncbi:MAG: CopG family transcriptional regulator [Sulfobacillus sp.]